MMPCAFQASSILRYSVILFRSEEHTSELQSLTNLVCRLLLERHGDHQDRNSFPTRRSSDLGSGVRQKNSIMSSGSSLCMIAISRLMLSGVSAGKPRM